MCVTEERDPIRSGRQDRLDGVFERSHRLVRKTDIADYLGLTIETVSRRITNLRKEGVIRIENNRRVIVPAMERLKRCAGIDD
jgi:CRP/FNR family transcriptional regulator, anaerobic regulatory protein